MKLISRIASVAAVICLAAGFALAQPPSAANQTLDARINAEITPFKGKVFVYAKNLETGKTYSYHGDERVRTASTIKVAVMIEAFARVAEGKAKWTDELVLTKAARYSGSGVLPELGDGLRLTLRDCVNLMMVVSDNTATNMVLDYLSTDAVNERMNSLGFKATRIMRRVGGGGESRDGKEPDNKNFGLGATSPQEMVQILEKLDRGEIVSQAAAKEMIELMKREQVRYAIARDLNGVSLASKYGALDRLRSCVAIVYAKRGKVAIAITVDDMPEIIWTVDNPGYLLMSRLSEILVSEL
jgi:beta-lactamase class A